MHHAQHIAIHGIILYAILSYTMHACTGSHKLKRELDYQDVQHIAIHGIILHAILSYAMNILVHTNKNVN